MAGRPQRIRREKRGLSCVVVVVVVCVWWCWLSYGVVCVWWWGRRQRRPGCAYILLEPGEVDVAQVVQPAVWQVKVHFCFGEDVPGDSQPVADDEDSAHQLDQLVVVVDQSVHVHERIEFIADEEQRSNFRVDEQLQVVAEPEAQVQDGNHNPRERDQVSDELRLEILFRDGYSVCDGFSLLVALQVELDENFQRKVGHRCQPHVVDLVSGLEPVEEVERGFQNPEDDDQDIEQVEQYDEPVVRIEELDAAHPFGQVVGELEVDAFPSFLLLVPIERGLAQLGIGHVVQNLQVRVLEEFEAVARQVAEQHAPKEILDLLELQILLEIFSLLLKLVVGGQVLRLAPRLVEHPLLL